ncbi:beta-ketoacyl-[acyl-carrier-protein] synthase family protein [Nocardia mexicana]|uniref:3-oxoacyl-[acyl-carrier-protein] synthase 1 n=1 Tax=Nocardia mexicana TaxID=279262 RepID=A0A370GNK7_9NOCA|nr:beta-ketoacyl-[acyl-carrier-protein] synthase family protein [Nocardia mexicana]RDI45257.1 3-oxoacyl-[acyl-carrier-protein] synthase II [Nocardia mexicana]
MSDTGHRRVVVTGLGVVSSIGIGAAAFGHAIRAGRSGMTPISSFDTSRFPKRIGGEVQDFDAAEHLERIDPADWGRSALFAAAAARLAARDAAIDPELLSSSVSGSVMGTTSGESAVTQRLAEQSLASGIKSMDPRLVRMTPANRIAGAVNSELGLTGEANVIATACSASNYALGYAYDMVGTGEADFMLAGGADAVNRHTHAGFLRLGALADDVIRPFDVNRSGIITGEGGVALFLEPLQHAQARGARIYAEVLGYGVNCDAKHMVHPDAHALARCIEAAHTSAGVVAADIDYICAHGTGTPANDEAEMAAIRAVFGTDLPPVSSIKSMLGHTMGAASGFGAAACCLALHDGFLPPTATLEQVDPALGADLDCVPGTARPAALRVVENHGFAFGGNNAITLLGRPT